MFRRASNRRGRFSGRPAALLGRKFSAERLEERTLMATDVSVSFNTSDRILRIDGTDNDDSVIVYNQSGQISVQVGVQDDYGITVIDGASVSTATSLDVHQIAMAQFMGYAGKDQIEMSESPDVTIANALPMWAMGGAGDDIIKGGSAADELYGGLGKDALFGNAGNDKLVGGYNITDEAASLDHTLGLYTTNNLWRNATGQGEVWLKDKFNRWYYIKPNGELIRSTNGSAAGEVVTILDPSYHRDVFQLVNAYDITHRRDIDFYLISAGLLDRNFDLYATDNLYTNWGGRNEKWIMSNVGWFYILPDGSLYHWDGSGQATGQFQVDLSPSFYEDISALVDAASVDSGLLDEDTLFGGNGNDRLYGYADRDTLVGERGNDLLYGGTGNDTLWGAGADNMYSYLDGRNGLYGQAGNDNLYGGNGPDSMDGGAGNDGMFGGGGTNLMYGGKGADRFIDWAGESNTISDLEAQDATLLFRNGGKITNAKDFGVFSQSQPYNFNAGFWTLIEVTNIDRYLQVLHRRLNNTRLLERPDGNSYTFIRQGQQTSGDVEILGMNDGFGRITIGQGRAAQMAFGDMLRTLYHEIGHSWGVVSVNPFFQDFLGLSGWRRSATNPGFG
ncbi:MAG: hypothetical protein KDA99_25190, partial [Planctomycetales bacterium]|nr:hypothetical protein [Planctomycetales bacterium]